MIAASETKRNEMKYETQVAQLICTFSYNNKSGNRKSNNNNNNESKKSSAQLFDTLYSR